MRTLTTTLLAAQKADRRRPYVEVKASNTRAGVVNLQWTRLYSGAEADSVHAATMPADGSLIRIYASTAATNRKLYRQRVTSPGPASDFSTWSYLNLYNIMGVAACSLAAEVSLFWVKNDGTISRIKSTDNGATWAAVEYPGYAPSGAVAQMAAAYKPNGDLALFFTDADNLYVIRHTAGSWVSRATWNKTTGILSGVAAAYDGDWKLLVSGLDAAGNFKVWSLIYGDGGEVTAGTWSADLLTIAAAPSDGLYSFQGLFLDKPDVYRGTFSEIFGGVTAVNRPYWMNTVPATAYLSNRWREPVPFNMAAANGLAMVHGQIQGFAPTVWLTTPFSVWRASLAVTSLDLTADVLAVKNELKQNDGALEVELQNSGGQYSTLPAGLGHGAQLSLSPGYQTPAGNEVSAGLVFTLQGYEHSHTPGKAALLLLAADGWNDLSEWTARYQFRWNPPDAYGDPTTESDVKEILTQILARCGINLAVISESADITAFYPDFTLQPGDNGKAAIKQLLSYVPDVLFLEGSTAYLVNPLSADAAAYSYGTDHVILEGRYGSGAWRKNRIAMEGYDPAAAAPVIVESYQWDEIYKMADRLERIDDLNIRSAAEAGSCGAARLREEEIAASNGYILSPVNCGQQLYDAIAITDLIAGLAAVKRRVLGISLAYDKQSAKYINKIILGGV